MTKEENKMIDHTASRFELAGRSVYKTAAGTLALLLWIAQASAASFTFSTGEPDGKIATLTRSPGPSLVQTETADDLIVTQSIVVSQATFTGLLPAGASL